MDCKSDALPNELPGQTHSFQIHAIPIILWPYVQYTMWTASPKSNFISCSVGEWFMYIGKQDLLFNKVTGGFYGSHKMFLVVLRDNSELEHIYPISLS